MESGNVDRELGELETALNLLKRDYEVYFSGGAKLPPLNSHRKLEREIRKYGNLTSLSYAQRFRYNNISARFNSYVDLWNKQMRNKEEGRTPSGGVILPAEPAPKKKAPFARGPMHRQAGQEYESSCPR